MEASYPKKFNCPKCPKTFKTKSHLKTYLVTHDGLVKCKICGKILKNLNSLPLHLSYTHGKESLPCDQCGRQFKCPRNLRRHVNAAEHAENPVRYYCTLCGKETKNKTDLDRHIGSHTTEKIYKCATCGLSFSQNSLLNLHQQRSHKEKSDRTVYTCKLCPRTFLSNTGRWLHIKLNHGDPIKYSCQSCDFQTVYKYRVKSHFTTDDFRWFGMNSQLDISGATSNFDLKILGLVDQIGYEIGG
ncbi:hypothetical protein Fcan01_25268 [Folsomia candida]|uniref:C2H2-type domain-containing protein n=1 Tax=Folsomia candida TaxID=158441 RepID=A0A226D5F5_FOLCA|nr:hypothetical protein Fcan01_25268 [Folsomia candida]